MMQEIAIKLPRSLDISEWELKMMLAAKMFEMSKLSSGQAAEVVGISKRAFIELAGKFNVSVFGYTADELKEDLQNL
jgi:predicted HTH domain antitoxin